MFDYEAKSKMEDLINLCRKNNITYENVKQYMIEDYGWFVEGNILFVRDNKGFTDNLREYFEGDKELHKYNYPVFKRFFYEVVAPREPTTLISKTLRAIFNLIGGIHGIKRMGLLEEYIEIWAEEQKDTDEFMGYWVVKVKKEVGNV